MGDYLETRGAGEISTPPRQRRADDRFTSAAICFGLATIVWLVFAQTLRHGFINYDDDQYVYQNPYVLGGLNRSGILWAGKFALIGHWHPLTWLSHMLDAQLWGVSAGGHHLTNVLLHALAAVLLFLALKQMTGALWRSALVAALFAIHPQRVESVAWIAERKDVLSGVFFMGTLLAYLHYQRRPSAFRYALIALSFALGLMSKGMLMTLPFVLLLLDYWPLGRFSENSVSPWRLIREKIPFFALSAASAIATALSPEKIAPALLMSLPQRTENAIVSGPIYLWQMLWPSRLWLPYFNPPGGFAFWQIILALILMLGLSVGAIVVGRTRPYLFVGWFWCSIMMLPVIGLMQISYYARADRYTYLPHIGLYLALVWGASELLRTWRYRREVSSVAAALLLFVLGLRAHAQTSR